MASPPTVDFDALLAPISEAEPCGVALKDDPALSSVYYAVKDAREAARAAERAGANAWGDDGGGQSSAGKPDWRLVVQLSSDALSKHSKDLWIAAWLLEGLTRERGFAGLRDGFIVVRELCERYFDGIYPRPDDDGIATTVAQLAGLNGEGAEGALLAPIAAIPITQGTSVGPFSGRDYADAENIAKTSDPDVRARRIAQGAATLDMFDTAAENIQEFFALTREDITAAMNEFDRMNAVLAEKCGEDRNGYSAAPASSKISAALAEALSRVRSLAGEPPDPSEEGVDAEAGSGGKKSGGNIASREDAFQTLMRVAEFFRRTEPHSPVSYAFEQAVRWGRMPLPELIRDLVSDESVRREFFRRTGMAIESDNG